MSKISGAAAGSLLSRVVRDIIYRLQVWGENADSCGGMLHVKIAATVCVCSSEYNGLGVELSSVCLSAGLLYISEAEWRIALNAKRPNFGAQVVLTLSGI